MDKLSALVPLLGWFYLSIPVLILVGFVLRRYFPLFARAFFIATAAYALVIAGQNYMQEFALFPEAKRIVGDPWLSKMEYISGDYYQTYFLGFRPYLKGVKHIRLYEASTREFYYVRMYLYPTGVLLVGRDDKRPGLAIMGKEDAEAFPNETAIATISGKILMKIGGDE